jgi:hypothetical protein
MFRHQSQACEDAAVIIGFKSLKWEQRSSLFFNDLAGESGIRLPD